MLGQADTSTPRVICWIARALRQGSEASETLSRTTRTRPDCVVNMAEKVRSGAWLTEVQGPTQRSSGQIRRRRVGVSFFADIGSVHAFFTRPPADAGVGFGAWAAVAVNKSEWLQWLGKPSFVAHPARRERRL